MTDVTAELVVALEVQELLTMLDDYFDRYIGATSEADMSLEELLISRSRTILAALARAKGGAMQDAAERALWWAHDQRLAALQEPGHG